MDLQSKLHQMTTLVTAKTPGGNSRGSGFFYSVPGQPTPNQPLGPPDERGRRYQYVRVDIWVITNRHVIMSTQNDGTETRPSLVTVHLRSREPSGNPGWTPITVSRADINERVKLHPNRTVEVAAINVTDAMMREMSANTDRLNYASPFMFKRNLHPDANKMIQIEASDDVLVVGYPRGFHDDANLFPIVKSGIVASGWGLSFRGQPCFLIDAKLFHGSSGSAVISKPTSLAMKDGQLLKTEDDVKAFVLLGVYSGSPHTWTETVKAGDLDLGTVAEHDLGLVWYPETIEETLAAGVEPG